MATFEIQGADGKTYQVEAPDMQTAAAALEGFATPSGGSSVNRAGMQGFQQGASDLGRDLSNAAVGVRNGLTLGGIDEIKGAIGGGLLGQVPGEGNFNYDVPIGERYRAVRDEERALMTEARDESPVATGAGDITGALGPALLAGPIAAGGKTLVSQIARLGAVGGAEGAVMGAGNSDGGDIISDAAWGGGLGAGLGVLAKPVAHGLQALGRTISAPIGGVVDAVTKRGSQGRANNVVRRALSRSGRSIEDLQRESAEAATSGQLQYTVADMLGDPGQGALAGVARTPGQGAREIAELLQSRQANAGDRMSGFLADSFDARDTAQATQSVLRNARDTAADANYSAARDGASPVDVRGALGVIDTRLGQTSDAAGTGFTGDNIDAAFAKYRSRLAADRVPGDIDAMELSDFDRVLGVKQSIQDDIGAAVRNGRNNEARELGALMRELDSALEASSPGYRTANDQFAQASRTIEAVDQGAAAVAPRTRASDNIEQFRAMTPEQQTAFRSGYGDRLIGKVESQPSGANRATPLLRDKAQAEIDAFANDPAALRAQIARENIMAETRQRAIGGSRTADNLANMEDVQNVDVGMIANLLGQNYGQAAVQGGQKIANVATGRNEATQQLIARMLMSTDPETALAPVLRQSMAQGRNNQVLQALLRQAGHQASN